MTDAPKSVTVKLARGTYTSEVDGKDHPALLLSREDEPGVVYPVTDTPEWAARLLVLLNLHGLGLFNVGLRGTSDYVENPEIKPVVVKVYVTAPGSDSVH